MFNLLKSWREKNESGKELLKNQIYLISLFVFVWASSCMFIVGTNYERMLALNIPTHLNIQPLIDGMWFLAYVALLIGLQLTAISGVSSKKAKFLIGVTLIAGVAQVLMYVFFFVYMSLIPALVLNLINLAAVWTIVFAVWKHTKVGSVLSAVFGLMSGYSVYLIIIILLRN